MNTIYVLGRYYFLVEIMYRFLKFPDKFVPFVLSSSQENRNSLINFKSNFQYCFFMGSNTEQEYCLLGQPSKIAVDFGCWLKNYTPGKYNLSRKYNARTNELHHENGCIKSSSQLRGEHCMCSSDFFPSECPGYVRRCFTMEKVGRTLTYNALFEVGWTILCNRFHGTVH